MTAAEDKQPAAPRRQRVKRHLRRLPGRFMRRLSQAAFALLVLTALYLSAGRLLMPFVAGRVDALEAQLSRSLGAPVRIGAIEGTWFRFGPRLEVRDLAIGSGEAVHTIRSVYINPDLSASILQRRPVIESLTVGSLDLGLQQNPDGRWALVGLASGTGPDYSQQILDFILGTRDIAFSEARLRVRTNRGVDVVLASAYLQLQNRGDRHELSAQFRLGGQAAPSQLMVEMDGDPREAFRASVYADVPGVDLAAMLADAEQAPWRADTLGGDASAWLSIDQNGIQQATATVANLGIEATDAGSGRTIRLANAGFAFTATPAVFGGDTTWNLRVADLGFDLDGRPWDLPALHAALPLGSGATLWVSAPELQLGMLAALAANLPLPERARSALVTLDPRGVLRNVQIESARDGSYPGLFRLRANLDEVAVDAWTGAPAGTGVDGYVEADAQRGFVEVASDHFTLHLPRLFEQPWAYDSVNARVNWDIGTNGSLWIGSTPILVKAPGLDGRVQFDINNSRNAAGQPVSEIALMVGVQEMDVALRNSYLPRLPRLQQTLDWLRQGLQGGTLRRSGLVMRASTLRGSPPRANSFAAWFEVEDGSLRFLPDWPLLENLAGDVIVRERTVDVTTRTASIAGIPLEPAIATVRPLPDAGSLLSVRGEARADTATGLDFLRTTPIRNQLGAFLDEWSASGMLDIDVALAIPLGNPAREREVAVDVESTASTLAIPDYALAITGIDGPVRWHSTGGLAAEGLRAVLFNAPVTAGIQTLEAGASRTTRITAEGRATVAALRDWPRQPAFVRGLLGYMRGGLDYTATLDIAGRDAADGVRSRLTLQSGLEGVESRLPAPVAKRADERAVLELNLGFRDDGQEISARYDDFLSAQLVMGPAGIDRGQLFLGELNRNFTVRQLDESTPGLLISGSLPDFNYEEWQAVAANLSEADTGTAATGTGERRTLADYLRLIDVDLGRLDILGQQLEDINVQVRYDDAAWHIQGSNALLAGRFTIPGAPATPWTIDLDYLRFPPREEPEPGPDGAEPETVDVLAGVDPGTLPPFDFATRELSIGEHTLGAFSFQLRPHQGGAGIADFRMTSPDATITDSQQVGGANIDWRYSGGMHTSSFTGLFAAGDLAVVLPTWGHDASVQSSSARFNGTLQWGHSPVAFTLKEASGQMQLDIVDGRFVSIDAGSARLFGALNFDSLIRRLQLDFSDIFGTGFAFDTISGNLTFRDGVVNTNTAGVLIDGPSSRIRINGEIDLARETIAADMQVQIPLGQNISMLAGLLGAWPIAVSTYIASKIFQEQVDDFATLIYRLDGPWETPTAGFEPGEGVSPSEPSPGTAPDANG